MDKVIAWLRARLSEKTSQAAIATGLTATATIASQKTSYDPGSWPVWLNLIPIWTAALVVVCLPEASGTNSSPKGD